ncbi:MAG: flagellar biosynthetic protein FliO [Planctomycetota bacterium]
MSVLHLVRDPRCGLLLGVAVLCSFGDASFAQGTATPPAGTTGTELPNYGSALARMLIVLAIMVAGLLVLAKFLPRWLNTRGLPRRGDSHIQVIDRVQLEPRRSLYLVQLGGQHYFLGSSETGIHLLREQPIDSQSLEGLDTDELPEMPKPRETPQSPPTAESFDGLLASKRT